MMNFLNISLEDSLFRFSVVGGCRSVGCKLGRVQPFLYHAGCVMTTSGFPPPLFLHMGMDILRR